MALRRDEPGCPLSPPRLLRPGPGAISRAPVRAASSASPAGKWKCASWIAAAATAVAADEEAVATPAGEPGRRAEARGSENRTRASLALGRAALRGPHATARPRAHARPRAARARGAGRGARAAAGRGLRPPRLALAAASPPRSSPPGTSRPQPELPAPPRPPAAPQPGALLARSHSTAYRLTPCMPPGPPAASGGSWADLVPGHGPQPPGLSFLVWKMGWRGPRPGIVWRINRDGYAKRQAAWR